MWKQLCVGWFISLLTEAQLWELISLVRQESRGTGFSKWIVNEVLYNSLLLTSNSIHEMMIVYYWIFVALACCLIGMLWCLAHLIAHLQERRKMRRKFQTELLDNVTDLMKHQWLKWTGQFEFSHLNEFSGVWFHHCHVNSPSLHCCSAPSCISGSIPPANTCRTSSHLWWWLAVLNLRQTFQTSSIPMFLNGRWILKKQVCLQRSEDKQSCLWGRALC